MSTTLLLVALGLGLTAVSVFLWAVSLRLGLRWAKVEGVTKGRVVLATALVVAFQMAVVIASCYLSPPTESHALAYSLIKAVLVVLFTCGVIVWVFRVRFRRSLLVWLPTFALSLLLCCFHSFVLTPFVYESFASAGNSMAPTLRGCHWEGVCPVCGKPNYCSPVEPSAFCPPGELMICDEFHTCQVPMRNKTVQPADRFIVAKFLAPRRWDLVVFKCPDNPSVPFVRRVVGLPGETIHIEDGAVWINGEKLTPPDSIRGLKYLSGEEIVREPRQDLGLRARGTAENPAVLGEDEYFVLGDFSERSMDSRFWGPGAVPAANLIGVVTHIGWPLARWRVFR